MISFLLLCSIAWAQTTVTVGGQFNMGSSVVLTWIASTGNTHSITNYNIYRGPTTGPYIWIGQVGAVTTFTDQAVPPSATACYVVTAVDSINVESAFSTETCATLP